MNAKIEELLNECCENPKDVMSWGEWIAVFGVCGVVVMNDDSGFSLEKSVPAAQARQAISRCTCQYPIEEETKVQETKVQETKNRGERPGKSIEVATVEIVSPELSIAEWRARYTQTCQHPPVEQILQTEDGSQVRLEIELFPNRPPLVYTRAYVPNIVCGKVGWFAQSINDRNGFGWKLILLPKARDEAIKHFGLDKNVVGVQAVRVIKPSNSNMSLLGEIAEW